MKSQSGPLLQLSGSNAPGPTGCSKKAEVSRIRLTLLPRITSQFLVQDTLYRRDLEEDGRVRSLAYDTRARRPPLAAV
jgi:hypothetical protein